MIVLISRDDYLSGLLVAGGIGGSQDIDAFLHKPFMRRELATAEVLYCPNLLPAIAGVVESRDDAFNIRVDELPFYG